jgi:hypothetical protein
LLPSVYGVPAAAAGVPVVAGIPHAAGLLIDNGDNGILAVADKCVPAVSGISTVFGCQVPVVHNVAGTPAFSGIPAMADVPAGTD